MKRASVLVKDFREYAIGLTDRIEQATQKLAAKSRRPLLYLASSSVRKEDFARPIAER